MSGSVQVFQFIFNFSSHRNTGQTDTNKSRYRRNSKIWDTSNNCRNCPKKWKVWCNIALMHPKDADGMANSVDPDQTASSEPVWSWSALFAETYLSQYIEFVRYCKFFFAFFAHPFYLNNKNFAEGSVSSVLALSQNRTGPKVIKKVSCPTQLSMK